MPSKDRAANPPLEKPGSEGWLVSLSDGPVQLVLQLTGCESSHQRWRRQRKQPET